MSTTCEPTSMWEIPAWYARGFKVYLSLTPELRSMLVDAAIEEVLAVCN